MKMILALMLAVAPTAAFAQSDSERIFLAAKVICPEQVRNNDSSVITREIRRRGFTPSETLLLLNFCLMYNQGAIDALGEIQRRMGI